jgi:SAM-dependent methyltransferase
MEHSDHEHAIDQAFTDQAASFNTSAIANAEEILEAIVAGARPRPSERWLEAACGPGVVSRRLATVARSVHGVDVTAAMIETAQREAVAAGLENVTFEVGDATRTTLADASFDGAVTRFSLHHIPVPGRLFEELARVLRPGGRLVVLDHLADDDAEVRSWSQEIERLRDPSHWASLSATRLRDLGRAAGLKLAHEQAFTFELDFDDWRRRGTRSAAAQELIERSLATPPADSDCFRVRTGPEGRILQLQMWLGVWHRDGRRLT